MDRTLAFRLTSAPTVVEETKGATAATGYHGSRELLDFLQRRHFDEGF